MNPFTSILNSFCKYRTARALTKLQEANWRKFNGFTNDEFIQWVNQLTKDREFKYTDSQNCLVATFLKEKFNLRSVEVGPEDYTIYNSSSNYKNFKLDKEVNKISYTRCY